MSLLTHEPRRVVQSPADVQRALRGLFAETFAGEVGQRAGDCWAIPSTRRARSDPEPPQQSVSQAAPDRIRGGGSGESPATATGALRPSWCHRTRPRGSGSRTKSSPYRRGGPTRDIHAQLAHRHRVAIAPPGVPPHGQAVAPHHGVETATAGRRLPRSVSGRPPLQGPGRRPGGQPSPVTLRATKDVLGMWIGAHESAQGWLTGLSELKSRGDQDVLVVAVDQLTGFSAVMATVVPQADVPPVRGPPDPPLAHVGRPQGRHGPHDGRVDDPVSHGGGCGKPTGDLLSVSRGVAADDRHDQPH